MHFIFLLLLLPLTLFAKPLTLKEKLAGAQEGSYLVLEQNKTYTLLFIRQIDSQRLVLEEVSIPGSLLPQPWSGWKCWFESGATNNTSWTMAVVHLESALFEEVYSFTKGGWLDITCLDTFLTTLLNLPFELVPESERRRVGLPPGYNKPDHRPLWQPRLIFNGCLIPNSYFSCWSTVWPNDASELARKKIFVYLPERGENPGTPHYPTYFPYLVEIEGKIGSAKVRVVDSGIGARSPKL